MKGRGYTGQGVTEGVIADNTERNGICYMDHWGEKGARTAGNKEMRGRCYTDHGVKKGRGPPAIER